MSSKYPGSGQSVGSLTVTAVQEAPAERTNKEEKMGNKSQASTEKGAPNGASITANRMKADENASVIWGSGYDTPPNLHGNQSEISKKAKSWVGNRADTFHVKGNEYTLSVSGSKENAGGGTRKDGEEVILEKGEESKSGNARDKD
ncbi:MAG: hypothetical protein Q9165_005577 [Trypethelium subeluteriae]